MVLSCLRCSHLPFGMNVTFMFLSFFRCFPQTLLSFEHNGFPIVEDDGQGRVMFRGMMLRSHIMVLLHEKAFQNFGYSLVGRQSNSEMIDAVGSESSQEFFIPPSASEDVEDRLVWMDPSPPFHL
jgi:hypothetical protein